VEPDALELVVNRSRSGASRDPRLGQWLLGAVIDG
jgi:hypothetical protein